MSILKLIIIIAVTFLSMLLAPLPSYAQRGGSVGGSGGRSGTNFGVDNILESLFGGRDYHSVNVDPVAKSHGILSIKVKTEDAEIYVDGKFIGRARDFKGPALLSVPSGEHMVEFKYNGSSVETDEINIIPGSTSFIVRDSIEPDS